jgi:hypothetical protein
LTCLSVKSGNKATTILLTAPDMGFEYATRATRLDPTLFQKKNAKLLKSRRGNSGINTPKLDHR